MRSKEFFIERANPLDKLKAKVKNQIDLTDDESLLNKIFTSLNSGTLMGRLSKGLETLSDPEIKTFLDDISTAIIQAPGSYEEKLAFVAGLHEGFIDVEKMLDGNRYHFSDLLKPSKKVSLKFLFTMFNSLKDLGGRAKKGPGEFAIAIMSPQVSVFGGGDLKIGKTLVEVKAGGGTIGATGYFQHSKVPVILQQYLPNINVNQNINGDALAAAIQASNLDPKTLKEFADKLVDYIFKAQEKWTNTDPLKKAIQNVNSPDQGDEIRRGYLTASYSAYKGREGGKSKFDGVMLMDFKKQELRYFDDPEELYGDVDKVQFNFFTTNKEWGSKLINPSVTLRKQPLTKPEVPVKPTQAGLQGYVGQQAEYLVRTAQQRNPHDLDLRDPAFQADVTANLKNMVNAGWKAPKINSELYKLFPKLNPKNKELTPVTTAPVKAGPTQNPPKFAKPAVPKV